MYKRCYKCDKVEGECSCEYPDFVDYLSEDDHKEKKETKNQIKKLIEFAEHNIRKTVVSKSDSSKVVVLIPINDHVESFDLSSNRMKHWLKSSYYDSTKEVFSDETYKSTLDLLLAKATISESTAREIIYNRVATVNDEIYYDLCSPNWKAVKISKKEVEIIPLDFNTPIFSRTPKQAEQVKPNFKVNGNALDEIVRLFRIKIKYRLIFPIHLISLILAKFAMPIMAITGEQGSIKSTISSAVKRIIDPSGSTIEDNTNKMPKTSDDLNILLYNKYCSVFDNLSYLKNYLSDDLCRAITGTTYQKRKLYTDSDEAILTFKRKIILNGIAPNIEYNDLLERTIFYNSDTIPKDQRITEEEFNTRFESLLPYVLGEIFKILSKALRIYPKVRQEFKNLPRMADFAIWGECISQALGNNAGDFLKKYDESISDTMLDVSYSHAIIVYIDEMMNGQAELESSVSEFYGGLKEWAEQHNYDTHSKYSPFPKAPNKLVSYVSRINPLLRNSGYEIQSYTNTNDSKFTKNAKILKIVKLSSPSSPSSLQQNQSQKQLDMSEDAGKHTKSSDVISSLATQQIMQENQSSEPSEPSESKNTTLEKDHWICKTHNAGPFGLDEASKSSGNILQLHKNNGCSIEYLTKEEARHVSQGRIE